MLRALDAELRAFPVIVQASARNGIGLRPMMADARSGLSTVVAQFYDASASGALDRLKMCASEDCRRVFYDRSKPGTRRWCQAALCGNRMKTRNYRERQKRVS
jgi:predicted RNA-binding Zn ribbon-like protein